MSKQKKKQSSSDNEAEKETLEQKLVRQMREAGFPKPQPQQPVTKLGKRKWSVDFFFPNHDLVVEVQGGTWIPGGGRHSRGPGYRSDCEKLNYLTCRHTKTVYVTSDMVNDGSALDWIYLALAHSWNAYLPVWNLGANINQKKLEAYLKKREEFYGKPLSLEAICSFNRIKRKKKTTRKKMARKKSTQNKKIIKNVVRRK